MKAYIDENGDYCITKGFINNKSIKRRFEKSKQVSIYNCNEHDVELLEEGYSAGDYITTILLN